MRSARLDPISFVLTRTGADGPDPATVIQRARPFAAGIESIGQATLLTVRDEVGISNYLVAPDHQRAAAVAANLAHAVGAEARRAESLPVLPAGGVIAWVVADPSERASRDTQSGGDPVEVARLLGREMTPGSWVAATVRRARKREVARTRAWYSHRLGGVNTHHSLEGEALVVTFLTGAPDRESARSLVSSLISALPGFDVEVEVRTGSAALRALGLAAVAPVLGVGADVGLHSIPLAVAAVAIPALAAAGYATHRIPTRADMAASQRDTLRFQSAGGLLIAPRKPHKEYTKTVRTKVDGQVVSEQRTVPEESGSYPLRRDTFLVGPSVLVGIAAPYTGAASGVASTATSVAPPALLADIGPFVGTAGESRVRISSLDQSEAVAIAGIAGRGKSVLVGNLFAFDVLERVRPSGKPGRPGRANSLIALESKGAGAAMYQRWIQVLGDTSVLVDLADPSSPGIDLLSVPGTAEQRADYLANMMQYVYGKQAIGDQSMNTLKSVFHAAFLIPPQMASDAVEGGFDAHPLAIGHGLLSGYGDEEGELIATTFVRWVKSLDESDARRAEAIRAARKLSLLYGPKVTVSQRRNLTSAPISKTGLLMSAGFWWSSDRPKTTWDQVLDNHWAVVVNTGSSGTGTVVGDDLTTAFSAMLAYSLRDAIRRCCDGWQKTRRCVTIFADELSLLAGSSGDVITWFRDQGRSYGVRPVFATQYPDQLAPEVLASLMSYSTFFWFAQNNTRVLEAAVADLAAGGGQFAVSDIANLQPYRAIMRTSVNKQRQPAVPVTIAYWGEDSGHPDGRESEFVSDQGYGTGVSQAPVPDVAPERINLADVPRYDPGDPFAVFEGR